MQEARWIIGFWEVRLALREGEAGAAPAEPSNARILWGHGSGRSAGLPANRGMPQRPIRSEK